MSQECWAVDVVVTVHVAKRSEEYPAPTSEETAKCIALAACADITVDIESYERGIVGAGILP